MRPQSELTWKALGGGESPFTVVLTPMVACHPHLADSWTLLFKRGSVLVLGSVL